MVKRPLLLAVPVWATLLRAVLVCLLIGTQAACSIRPASGLPGAAARETSLRFSHQLEIQRGPKQGGSALSFISVDNHAVHFVLTTLTGQPLIEAHYDDTGYHERYRDAQFPSRFHSDYLLRDLCWALWPAALLTPDLARINMRIREEGTQRWLLDGHQTVLNIQHIDGRLHLTNQRFGYTIDLTPLDDSAASSASNTDSNTHTATPEQP